MKRDILKIEIITNISPLIKIIENAATKSGCPLVPIMKNS